MRATFNRFPTALTTALGLLAALALLLSVQGCGTTADATTTVTGPTPAKALEVFNAYVTAERVATANQDQSLATEITSSAQYSQVSVNYAVAAVTGQAMTSPTYGKPTLYVPKLTTYPQWFMATAPVSGKGQPAGTALMVFDRLDATTNWVLENSVLLDKDAPALNVAIKDGYATALRTTETGLRFRPDEVGAMQASVVDEGPHSPAGSVVAAGPLTTGIYQASQAMAVKARAQGNYYSWELEGSSYPFFALSTTDGGAIVVYTMGFNTQTLPAKWSPKRTLPVPDGFKPLLPADQGPITKLLDADSTFQYLAIDPPPVSKGGGKLQVIGSYGGPSYVKGT
ncbi:MAG TPA: hypothetical protein VGG50_01990 [Streptosporangiaceae bacterium]|jgi:hypothetical protein